MNIQKISLSGKTGGYLRLPVKSDITRYIDILSARMHSILIGIGYSRFSRFSNQIYALIYNTIIN